MIPAERAVLLLLAAGRSTRFGGASKLAAELDGRPLALHAAAALAPLPWRSRLAVIGDGAPDFVSLGFETIRNPDPARGQASSIALGIARASDLGADAAVIALADMPRVTAAHVGRLLDAAEGAAAVVMSSDGEATMPPGVFGRGHFARLAQLTGDQGARDLFRGAHRVLADRSELIDVDTQADLERLRAHR